MSEREGLRRTSWTSSGSSTDSLTTVMKTPTSPPARFGTGYPVKADNDRTARSEPRISRLWMTAPDSDAIVNNGHSTDSEGHLKHTDTSEARDHNKEHMWLRIRSVERKFFGDVDAPGILDVNKTNFSVPSVGGSEFSSTSVTTDDSRTNEEGQIPDRSWRVRAELARATKAMPSDRRRFSSHLASRIGKSTLDACNPSGREIEAEKSTWRSFRSFQKLHMQPTTRSQWMFDGAARHSKRDENNDAGATTDSPGRVPKLPETNDFVACKEYRAIDGKKSFVPFIVYSSRTVKPLSPDHTLEKSESPHADSSALRQRCLDLEATVEELQRELLKAKSSAANQRKSPTEPVVVWRRTENSIERAPDSPSRMLLPELSSKGSNVKSPSIVRDESAVKKVTKREEAPRAASASVAFRSVSPQSPKGVNASVSLGSIDELRLTSNGRAPSSFSPERQCVHDRGAYFHAKHRSGVPPPDNGAGDCDDDVVCAAELNVDVDRAPDAKLDVPSETKSGKDGEKTESGDELLEYEMNDESVEAVMTAGNHTATDDDNLQLVLAERQVREFKKSFERAQEDANALRVELEKHRLRRDELETQVLAQEEQILSQKDKADQQIHDLREEVAKLRSQSTPEVPATAIPAAEKLLALLQDLASFFLSEEVTEENKDIACMKIEAMAGILQSTSDASADASAETAKSLETEDSTCANKFATELRGIAVRLASLVGPGNAKEELLAGITGGQASTTEVFAAVSAFTGLVQETAETQAVQLAELREELEVVRKDRNELIGQQSEQVRALQEALLEKDTEQLQLMERGEAMRQELEALLAEKETLSAQHPSSVAATTGEGFDRDEWERALRAKFEEEKRVLVAEWETRLKEQKAKAEAARRAQHSVFAERLSTVQSQLRNVRVVNDEERDKYAREATLLRTELEATKAALEAKEIALSIALRDDIVRAGSTKGSENQSTSVRGRSLSLSSHGVSGGESTTVTRRADVNDASQPNSTNADGTTASTVTSVTMPPGVPASLAELLRAGSAESSGDRAQGSVNNSPSPLSLSPEHLERLVASVSHAAAATTSTAWDSRSPPSFSAPTSTAPMVANDRDTEKQTATPPPQPTQGPRRPAPVPTLTPSPSKSPLPPRSADSSSVPRKVTFAGVSPSSSAPTPSPKASHRKPEGPSPTGATDATPARAPRAVSRSLSTSFAPSPTNAGFLRDASATVEGEEIPPLPKLSLSRSLSPIPIPMTQDVLEGTPSPLAPAPKLRTPTSMSLRQRSVSEANTVGDGDGGSASKTRRFVKMGSLQRVREVWSKQENMMLGTSPGSTEKARSPSTR